MNLARRNGLVAEWLRRGLQILVRGFDSLRGLHEINGLTRFRKCHNFAAAFRRRGRVIEARPKGQAPYRRQAPYRKGEWIDAPDSETAVWRAEERTRRYDSQGLERRSSSRAPGAEGDRLDRTDLTGRFAFSPQRAGESFIWTLYAIVSNVS